MKIFGLIILRDRDLAMIEKTMDDALSQAGEQVDYWKAKYYYAKARALVAERFRNPTITVKPVAMGVDSGVHVEVGIRPPEES